MSSLRLRLIILLALSSCEPGPESTHGESRAALGVETNVDAPVTGIAAIRQSNFAAAFNGTQWMTAWTDQRMSNTGGQQVWGARVTVDGGVLDPFGLQLTYGRGGNHPAVACVPAYCWIVWTDVNSLEGVRIAPNGTFVDPGVVVFTGSTGTIADIALATNGTDFFTAWTDSRSGVQSILGKSLTLQTDGGFPPDLVLSSGALVRRRPVVVSVDAGYLVAWSDLRGANADIWALQVLDAGSVLGPETQISSASTVDDFVSGAVEPATGNVLLTWDTATDIFGRRVRVTAAPVDAAPFSIDSSAGTQRRARTVFDGTQWAVAYEGTGEQRATLVSPAGVANTPSVISDGGGVFVAIAPSNVGRDLVGWDSTHVRAFVGNPNDAGSPEGVISLTLAQSASAQFDVDVAGVDGGFLVVWQDSRADALRPTARWFTSAGNPSGASFDLSVTPSRANRGRAAIAGPGGQAIAMWMSTGVNSPLLLTRFNSLGAPIDVPPLSSSDGFEQDNPSGAYGPGAYLVAFEEPRATTDIYGFIVQRGGAMAPVTVASTAALETAPAVAGSTTQWLVAWVEGTNVVAFSRVDSAGVVQPRTQVPGVSPSRGNPAVASDGTGFLLVWLDNGTNILGVRIDQNGALRDVSPITLALSASAGNPGVIWDGLRYLVTWRVGGAVVTRTVPPVGAPSATSSTLMTAANNHRSAVLAMSGDDGFVAATSNIVPAPYASPRITFNRFTESSGPTACTIELDCKTLSCVSNFCVAFDAGFDAGVDAGIDAGPDDAGVDAGPGDAGIDAGVDAGMYEPDGGARSPLSLIVGCGCSTGDSPVLLLLFAVLISRRRSLRQ